MFRKRLIFQRRDKAIFFHHNGSHEMRTKAVTTDEQYRLIMECRASGMTDYQWCMAHNIKPGTFYNWIRRLRQNGNMDIPASAKNREPARQDIMDRYWEQGTRFFSVTSL